MHAIADASSLEGRRKLIASELGARAIKLNRFDPQPGQAGFEHDERKSGQEEIYLAVEGDGVIRVGPTRSRSSRAASCWSRRRRRGK